RIYEGTNEINRMLVPTRLLKQSPDMFSAAAVRAALDADASAIRGPQSAMPAEREFVARLKKLSIALLGQASATYGDGLKSEQEVLAQIAVVIFENYATESGIARADKIAAQGGAIACISSVIVR